MFKMNEFIKGKRRLHIIIVVICLVVLSGSLFIGALAQQPANSVVIEQESIRATDRSLTQPEVQTQPPSESQSQVSPQPTETLDEAVGYAILGRSNCYGLGEVATQGHVILDKEEKNDIVTVYTVSSFRWFGFENGIFTSVSGSGNIPTVIKFTKSQDGGYSLLDYQEPADGAGYTESIKKMFPKVLWDKVLTSNDNYPELLQQMEDQARQYLQSIGRNAEVRSEYVEKTLLKINVEASNKLFAEFTKNDAELNSFPYWVGTKEYLINGLRFIYETAQSKTDDGSDLVIFKKTTGDGAIVLEYRYKIVGNEPTLIAKDVIDSLVYKNTLYGFSFTLPASWKGYSIIEEKWEGQALGGSEGEQVIETGPLLSIRHPQWTDTKQRQDIPIMVFTQNQWKQLQEDKFHIGAAPIGPMELGQNSKYVFALPARYIYAFPEGFEEVDKILQNNPLNVE